MQSELFRHLQNQKALSNSPIVRPFWLEVDEIVASY